MRPIDDSFDDTYCDIYAQIAPPMEEQE